MHFQLFGHQGETDGLSGRKENMCHKCLHHDFCHSKGFKDRATWPGVLQLAILQSPETWQEFQAIAAWAAGTLAANLARQELNSARFAQMLLSLCQRSNKKSFPTEMVHFKSLDFWMTSRGFMGFLLKSHEYIMNHLSKSSRFSKPCLAFSLPKEEASSTGTKRV